MRDSPADSSFPQASPGFKAERLVHWFSALLLKSFAAICDGPNFV